MLGQDAVLHVLARKGKEFKLLLFEFFFSGTRHGATKFSFLLSLASTIFPKKKKKKGCSAVSEYRRLLVSEHGRLDGASTEAIKAEIFARGPISCGIDATEELDGHEGPGSDR